MSQDWNRKFATPIRAGRGRTFRTLSDVRAFVLDLPEDHRKWSTWLHVARTLLEAAEGGDVERVPIAFALARMHGGIPNDRR